MSIVEVKSEISYSVHAPTSFIFNVMADQTDYQILESEELVISPQGESDIDEVANERNRFLRIRRGTGRFTLSYRARVNLKPEFTQPPAVERDETMQWPRRVLPYLNPSRYCESDRLGNFAWREFGQLEPGFTRVIAICNWTYDYLQYVSGSTNSQTSACDVLLQRTGVCRDYAHLAITLCRAMSTPARYVSGYAVGLQPPDFHGFFEAFLSGRWYLFDATRMVSTHGLVRIGTGRDASDASFATIIGDAVLENLSVSAIGIEYEVPDFSTSAELAVSTV